MDQQILIQKLTILANKAQAKNHGKPLQILIHSDQKDLHFDYPLVQANPIFHVASVGKLLSTVLILKAVEAGKLSVQTRLADHLELSCLQGLFLSDPREITILDCLTHRSGAADFFEGKDKNGKSFLSMIMEDPNKTWTQEDLLDYVRNSMKPRGHRGETFAYGDTAFMLATMVLEKIEGKPFNILLDEGLFKPLGMKDSQSMIYKVPKNQAKKPQDIWLGKHEVKAFNILSVDQADGGIVSTPSDLVTFQKALYAGQLISQQSLDLMQQWQGKFRAGIHYGTGMMQVRFEEFFFLMRNFPRPIGHIGILATQCFYIPEWDMHLILNFGSSEHMTSSFVFLSKVVGLLKSAL